MTIYRLGLMKTKLTVYKFGTKMKVTVWPQKMKLNVYKLESTLIVYRFVMKTTAAVYKFRRQNKNEIDCL